MPPRLFAERYICALARLLPIDLQLFYCLLPVFNSNPGNNCFGFRAVDCTYMYIQKEISRLIFARHDSHCIRDAAASAYLFKLVYFNWDSICADCQPESLFSYFVCCALFCLRDNLPCLPTFAGRATHELVKVGDSMFIAIWLIFKFVAWSGVSDEELLMRSWIAQCRLFLWNLLSCGRIYEPHFVHPFERYRPFVGSSSAFIYYWSTKELRGKRKKL